MGALLAAIVLLSAAGAEGACGGEAAEPEAWEDTFRSLRRLKNSRHVTLEKGGGISVTFARQIWEIPGSTPFSAGIISPDLEMRTAAGPKPERLDLKAGNDTGDYWSPVLDTYSPSTRWEKIEWDMVENYGAKDESCDCPSPGSPLTPVVITYGVGDDDEPACTRPVPWPTPEAGSALVRTNGGGRYLRLCARLYSRRAAGQVSPDLAPGSDADSSALGLKPGLKKLRITYYARAAHAVGRLIAPKSLGSWGEVDFKAFAPGEARADVDVLSEDGRVLLAGVTPGTSLSRDIDPFEHPAVRLRARLGAAGPEGEHRAILKSWRLSWRPAGERLRLDRKSFAPGPGEAVRGIVCVEKGGVLKVRVHDADGKTVRLLARRWVPPRAQVFSWDGLGRDGQKAARGRYFVTASTAGGSGTRSVSLR